MSDSAILYAGIVCFSLIILGFVLTVREFSRTVARADSGKRESQAAYRT